MKLREWWEGEVKRSYSWDSDEVIVVLAVLFIVSFAIALFSIYMEVTDLMIH
jgi:hypothetical protein